MVSSPLLPYYFCLSPSPWDTHTGRAPGRCACLGQLATATLSGACPVLVKKAQTVSCTATASHPVGAASEAHLVHACLLTLTEHSLTCWGAVLAG